MTDREIEQRATRYLIELEATCHSKRASRRTWRRIETWFRQDPRHEEIFRRVDAAWRMTEHLQAAAPLPNLVHPQTKARFGESALEWLGARWLRVLFLVTAPVLAGGLAGYLIKARHFTDWSYFATGYGQSQSIGLQDGSTVQENGNTRFGVRTSRSSNEIRLVGGDVLIEVPAVRTRSLVVLVDQTVIEALGTRFSVRRIDERKVDAVVTQGRVRVTVSDPLTASAANPSVQTTAVVDAGSRVVINSGRISVQPLTEREVEDHLGWLRGMVVFDGTLADALAEFNRYNRRRLVLANPTLANVHVSVRFQANDPAGFAKTLLTLHGIPSKSVFNRETGQDDILVGARP